MRFHGRLRWGGFELGQLACPDYTTCSSRYEVFLFWWLFTLLVRAARGDERIVRLQMSSYGEFRERTVLGLHTAVSTD